ncbi:hypothetical protein LPJ56_004423 [Coemansia sp. RSA 2599]|nr:hypothetical protein LPJ56_004423 [Coemansia sp. RSA 2599]
MSTKIFVGSLSYDLDEEALKLAFSEFGEVSQAKIIFDNQTGRSRGFGFVTFATPEAAADAMEKGNGMEINGRAVAVNEAKERDPNAQPRTNNYQNRPFNRGGYQGRRNNGDFNNGGNEGYNNGGYNNYGNRNRGGYNRGYDNNQGGGFRRRNHDGYGGDQQQQRQYDQQQYQGDHQQQQGQYDQQQYQDDSYNHNAEH